MARLTGGQSLQFRVMFRCTCFMGLFAAIDDGDFIVSRGEDDDVFGNIIVLGCDVWCNCCWSASFTSDSNMRWKYANKL